MLKETDSSKIPLPNDWGISKCLYSCLQILWNLASLTALSILYWQQQSEKIIWGVNQRAEKKAPLIHHCTNPYCLQKGKCFRAPFNSNILTSLFVFPGACMAFPILPPHGSGFFNIIWVRAAHNLHLSTACDNDAISAQLWLWQHSVNC